MEHASPIQEVNCPVSLVQSEEVGVLNTCQIQSVSAFCSEWTSAERTAVLLRPFQEQVELTAVCCEGKTSSVSRRVSVC